MENATIGHFEINVVATVKVPTGVAEVAKTQQKGLEIQFKQPLV